MSFQSGPSRGPNPFGLSGSLAGHHPPPPPAGHITQRPLGPPTQPSQSGSSSSRPWPLNIPGGPLQLFFDPHSARASKLKRELEAKLTSRGAYLPVAQTTSEATHLVLDPDCAANGWLRRKDRDDQHIVSLGWIESSFRQGASADEQLYRVEPEVARWGVEATKGKLDKSSGAASGGGGERGDEVRQGPSEARPVRRFAEVDTSGSDEEVEIRSELESDSEDDSQAPADREKLVRTHYTDSDRKELAILLASSVTPQVAYEEFSRKHPIRNVRAVSKEHRRRQPFYDAAVERIRKKHNPTDPGNELTTSRSSRLDTTPNRIHTSSGVPPPTVKERRSREPEGFRLPGVPPSSLPSADTNWCFFCGDASTLQKYHKLQDLVGWRLRTQADGSTVKVYERVVARRACKNQCYNAFRAGLRGDRTYALARELPKGLGSLQKLGWLTEQLLVRGMKKRRDAVEGV